MTNLGRIALAELIGTMFLVAAVVGSGIAAQRLSPNDIGLQLLENSLITGAALAALILALQPVSAAFNPLVTLAERFHGTIDTATASAAIASQFIGAITGCVVANVMFGQRAIEISSHHRGTSGHWLGEVVATAGLLIVIFGAARSGRTERISYAVGGYIVAAYWFTSSTSFANPAVTTARMFSNTFAGIAPISVPGFIAAQVVGAIFGLAVVALLYPARSPSPSPTITEVLS